MPESPSGVREPPGAPAIDLLPASFGKYFLTEKLATGGMAEIYLAKIVGPGGFEKQLVIKLIHPRLSGQRHFVDLFVAEAKTLVTLAHGNIVPVYELGVIDDTYFIAMEYIDGPTLYRLTEALRRRGARMAPAVAAWITARILEGLDYAHRKGDGVIHRDLSPRNVMLSRDGEVNLVDFGIAVTLGADSDDGSQSAPTGSFPYMSPEQVRKESLTGQTDLFSTGVLLWEMLVGHRLFARSDPDATLHAVLDGDIARPSAENPDVPARLDDVVMRALERDMTARWSTAGDMLAALQRYLYSLDDPPGPRDVAALVARYCPPETRRLPTHHDEFADAEPSPITRPHARAASVAPDELRPGPATAVIPRDDAVPRGKRPSRARTESFATNVDLAQMLERGAVPGERPADRAEAATGPDATAGRDDATPVRPSRADRVADVPDRPGPEVALPDAREGSPGQPPLTLPGGTAPAAGMLLVAGAGALVLGGAAIVVFLQGRGAVLRPDAARRDAPLDLAPDAATPNAAPPDAAPAIDAGEPVLPPVVRDAGTIAPRDAGIRPPRPDARTPGELLDHRDAAARPGGTATLTVGAIPWGTVLLDGKPIGRTPIDHLAVPAGHHVVSVTFSGEDPPRTQTYPIDVGNGESRDLVADFTRP
ncbi:MAG: PEGA domain-containing protein [Deltaproteobacteria bacterium]|nr:MAG: PEGA domain-containing protein [Deltaproteobacteria bacterium]